MVRRSRVLWLALGLLLSLPASAHKLKVFATAEGDRILGQTYFVGGAPASGASVRITDGEGHELVRLQPDERGDFSYRVERRMDYRVVADSRDGHVASWSLKADEFASSLPPGTVAASESEPAAAPPQRQQTPPAAPGSSVPLDQVEQAVARQIRPLREAMQASEERVRLHDILGGIGYIVGLAGLGLWWGGRRRSRSG